jgi:hypothetical protein
MASGPPSGPAPPSPGTRARSVELEQDARQIIAELSGREFAEPPVDGLKQGLAPQFPARPE